jgi:hypothetical protein
MLGAICCGHLRMRLQKLVGVSANSTGRIQVHFVAILVIINLLIVANFVSFQNSTCNLNKKSIKILADVWHEM